MLIIADADFGDIAALSKLVNSAYRGDESRKGRTTEADLLEGIRIDEETLHQYLSDPNARILKCIDDDNIIQGCIYLRREGDHLYIGMLSVSPRLQNKGIGKLLLQKAEQEAQKSGFKSIVMTVITMRKELIEWYKRHGYKETGEVQPFPKSEKFGRPKVPLEFIVMEKVLL